MKTGTLYIVATPIGHLEDITLRALRVLKEADLIASEDTRTTRKLLTHYQISKPLVAVFEYTSPQKLDRLVDALREGKSIAYVTEAGTPGISDPGARLVALAYKAALPVVPIPGASAVAAAVSVAGFSTDQFCFVGFLPRKSSKRRKAIESFRELPCPLILFESPHRIAETLEDLIAVLGDRPVLLARELTKMYEEVRSGTLRAIQTHVMSTSPRGEYTLVIAPHEPKGTEGQDPRE